MNNNTQDGSKTGIELITQERKEQIEMHYRTIEDDVKFNHDYQLSKAASLLTNTPDQDPSALESDWFIPDGWAGRIWDKMKNKPYKERLIIAGALIAAEIDRLNYLETV